MKKLKQQYEQTTFQHFLLELFDGDKKAVNTITTVLEDIKNLVEPFVVLEEKDMVLAQKLSHRQIRKLFRAASAISKGEVPEFDKKSEAQDLVASVNKKIKALTQDSNETPVADFEERIERVTQQWPQTEDRKNSLRMVERLKQFGVRNPSKTRFLLKTLGVLYGIRKSQHLDTVAPAAIKTALKIAQGHAA